jgi:hypothetical protein
MTSDPAAASLRTAIPEGGYMKNGPHEEKRPGVSDRTRTGDHLDHNHDTQSAE